MKALCTAAAAAVLIGLTLVILLMTAQTPQDHPKKEVFRDVASWPTTASNDVKLKNFGPLLIGALIFGDQF